MDKTIRRLTCFLSRGFNISRLLQKLINGFVSKKNCGAASVQPHSQGLSSSLPWSWREKRPSWRVTSCHPPSVKNGFVKGQALRIFRTNFSRDTFQENSSKFKRHLRDRGYPRNLVEKLLSEIKFRRRGSVLKGNNKLTQKDILPFVTQYRPSVSNLKQALLKKWHLIQNQPLLRQNF